MNAQQPDGIQESPKNNQEVWRKLEEAVRSIVTKQHKDAYVVTGRSPTGLGCISHPATLSVVAILAN
jgi:DNA/RNA endonuclease G (NUC1)